jgi:hypothetical protein
MQKRDISSPKAAKEDIIPLTAHSTHEKIGISVSLIIHKSYQMLLNCMNNSNPIFCETSFKAIVQKELTTFPKLILSIQK